MAEDEMNVEGGTVGVERKRGAAGLLPPLLLPLLPLPLLLLLLPGTPLLPLSRTHCRRCVGQCLRWQAVLQYTPWRQFWHMCVAVAVQSGAQQKRLGT